MLCGSSVVRTNHAFTDHTHVIYSASSCHPHTHALASASGRTVKLTGTQLAKLKHASRTPCESLGCFNASHITHQLTSNLPSPAATADTRDNNIRTQCGPFSAVLILGRLSPWRLAVVGTENTLLTPPGRPTFPLAFPRAHSASGASASRKSPPPLRSPCRYARAPQLVAWALIVYYADSPLWSSSS